MNLKGRNFLTLKDFTPEEITYMIDLAAELKAKKKAGELHEYYKGKKQNLIFYLYFIHEWKGIPSESNEMKPEWFDIDSIPYEKMFPVFGHHTTYN